MNLIKHLPLKVVLLDERCKPAYAKEGDAAFDLRARIPERIWIGPGERVLIPTGLRIALPFGFAGLVCPRSGAALKQGLSVTNSPGLCDAGYRDEVGVIAEARGNRSICIEPYDRIAQYAVVPVYTARFQFVDELDETERGVNGFGSTGKQ